MVIPNEYNFTVANTFFKKFAKCTQRTFMFDACKNVERCLIGTLLSTLNRTVTLNRIFVRRDNFVPLDCRNITPWEDANWKSSASNEVGQISSTMFLRVRSRERIEDSPPLKSFRWSRAKNRDRNSNGFRSSGRESRTNRRVSSESNFPTEVSGAPIFGTR